MKGAPPIHFQPTMRLFLEGGLFTPSSLLASRRAFLSNHFEKFFKFVKMVRNRALFHVQFHGDFVLCETETSQEKDFPILLRDSLGNAGLHILQGCIQVVGEVLKIIFLHAETQDVEVWQANIYPI